MTLFNFGAIQCAFGNAIHISPEVIEFGTVDVCIVLKITKITKNEQNPF